MELREQLIVLGLKDVIHLIDHIQDTSFDPRVKRFRVRLKNCYELSIIVAPELIPVDCGEVEVAAFDWNGEMNSTLIGCDYPYEVAHVSKIGMIDCIKMVGSLDPPSLSSQLAYVGKMVLRFLLNTMKS